MAISPSSAPSERLQAILAYNVSKSTQCDTIKLMDILIQYLDQTKGSEADIVIPELTKRLSSLKVAEPCSEQLEPIIKGLRGLQASPDLNGTQKQALSKSTSTLISSLISSNYSFSSLGSKLALALTSTTSQDNIAPILPEDAVEILSEFVKSNRKSSSFSSGGPILVVASVVRTLSPLTVNSTHPMLPLHGVRTLSPLTAPEGSSTLSPLTAPEGSSTLPSASLQVLEGATKWSLEVIKSSLQSVVSPQPNGGLASEKTKGSVVRAASHLGAAAALTASAIKAKEGTKQGLPLDLVSQAEDRDELEKALEAVTDVARASVTSASAPGLDPSRSDRMLRAAANLMQDCGSLLLLCASAVASYAIPPSLLSQQRSALLTAAYLASPSTTPWSWDITRPLSHCCGDSEGSGAERLCSILAESVSLHLSSIWIRNESQRPFVQAMLLVPSSSSSSSREQQAATLVIGRVFFLIGCDSQLARSTLPLLMESVSPLLSRTKKNISPSPSPSPTPTPLVAQEAKSGAYSCFTATLARMAAASARMAHGDGCGYEAWTYEQVLGFLIRLYRDTGMNAVSRQALASALSSLSLGMSQAPDTLMSQAPDTLMSQAPDTLTRDLRTRLMTLFDDLGRRSKSSSSSSSGEKEAMMALLPAIAAACELKPRGGESGEACEDYARLCRSLWLHLGLLGACLSQTKEAKNGSEDLKEVAGRIAAHSPPLLFRSIATAATIAGAGSPEAKEGLVNQMLAAEMGGERLAVTHASDASVVTSALNQALGLSKGASASDPLPEGAARRARLLAAVACEMSRSSSLSSISECPLSLTFVSLKAAHESGEVEEAAWMTRTAERAYETYLASLSASTPQQGLQSKASRLQGLAVCLVNHLNGAGKEVAAGASSGGIVAGVADKLLAKLLVARPGLLWNHSCLLSLLSASKKGEGEGGRSSVARARLDSWVRAMTSQSPLLAEALIHSLILPSAASRDDLSDGALDLIPPSSSSNKKGGLKLLCEKQFHSGLVSGLRRGLVAKASKGVHEEQDALLLLSRPPKASRGVHEEQDALLCSSFSQGLLLSLQGQGLQGQGLQGASESASSALLSSAALLSTLPPPTLPTSDPYPDHQAALLLGPHPRLLNLLRDLASAPLLHLSAHPSDKGSTQICSQASSAWSWLAMTPPSVTGGASWTTPLASYLSRSWHESVAKGQGIFSSLDTPGLLPPSDESLLLLEISTHETYLDFMSQLWLVSSGDKNDPSEEVEVEKIFSSFLSRSFESNNLCSHPCALTARVKLTALALRFSEWAQAEKGGDKEDKEGDASLIRTRALRSMAMWFSHPPSYTARGSEKQGEERVMALKSLNSLLASSSLSSPDSEAASLLQLLLSHEADRLIVWSHPLTPSSPSDLSHRVNVTHIQAAWRIDPKIALSFSIRYPESSLVKGEILRLISQHAKEQGLKKIPLAAVLLASSSSSSSSRKDGPLAELSSWSPAGPVEGLELLSSPSTAKNESVKAYALKCLASARPEQVVFFLPQLVQSLRSDPGGAIQSTLLSLAAKSDLFAHQLMWALQTEMQPPEEAFNPEVKRSGWKPPKDYGLWEVSGALRVRVLSSLSPPSRSYWEAEDEYFNKVTSISGILKKLDKEERKAKICDELTKFKPKRDDLYLPTNPDCRVLAHIPSSGTPMQSAAKVPILVAFNVAHQDPLAIDQGKGAGEDQGDAKLKTPASGPTRTLACIFKVGDDVRQDVLALQVVKLLKDAFTRAGLDLYLCPYGCLPTGYERGVIEVVPKTKSRAGLGEMNDAGLHEIFQAEYGPPGTTAFEAARRNFIISEAGYAIASFLLQAKDRHNGNLLIDSEGHLVHIDFGFILEISPGGNMKFENAEFKLSHEMCQLVDPGGTKGSKQYLMFQELVVRGYLVARTIAEPIIATVSLMAESGLPCFGRGAPVENLRRRFHLEMNEGQAAEFMRGTIEDAYQKWTTAGYDALQYAQNKIPY